VLTPARLLAQDTKVEAPKVVGVLMYADWCSSCKVLEPKLNQVKRGFENQPILFTRFDLTDEFTIDQSAHFAALLGLEKLFMENGGKTGYMVRIEWPSRRSLGVITKDETPEKIKAKLSSLVK
jgi:thiol-disulfide isomerase/thioredoxin